MVVGGAGDCAAGAVGNGIVHQGVLSTSIGTSGVMFVHSDQVKIDPAGRIHTFCHAVRGKWHMMGVSLSAGGSLQWFRNQLCQADVAAARRAKTEVYDILAREAAAVPVGSEGLFFLPYLSGERTPHADPDARGCFIGLTLAHGRGHLIRAIMEGVTYSLRDSLEIIEGLGVPVRQIRASGGGSRSPLWRQIQADCFGRKVATINSEEGAAYGVALLAAVGAGEFKQHRRGLRSSHLRGPGNDPRPRRQAILRPGVSPLPATLPLAQGRFQAYRGPGGIDRRRSEELKESYELLDRHSRIANQRPERSFGKLPVIWNRQSSVWGLLVPQDKMASRLVIDFIADRLEGRNCLTAGNGRQFCHKSTSTISSEIGGEWACCACAGWRGTRL